MDAYRLLVHGEGGAVQGGWCCTGGCLGVLSRGGAVQEVVLSGGGAVRGVVLSGGGAVGGWCRGGGGGTVHNRK